MLLRLPLEIILQDLLRTLRVPTLRIQRRPTVVWGHTISTTERILHVTPGVVRGGGLDVPDIACVAAKLARGEGIRNGIGVADGTAGGVDEPGALMRMSGRVSLKVRGASI